MCEYPCFYHDSPRKFRKLTLCLLDCWQREYDKRPYRYFKFERLMLEERLQRRYEPKQDFTVIVEFLRERFLSKVKLLGFTIFPSKTSILYEFVLNLQNLKCIELKLMQLPIEFFQLLAQNSHNMSVTDLSLEATPLNFDALEHLHVFIINAKFLLTLNVASCSINQYNFALLADAIYKSSSLRSCNLSYIISLHLIGDSEKLAHTIASLIWQNKLQSLELENCGLRGHDMEILAEYLNNNCNKLQELNISYNQIGANGALELFKAISKNKHFKILKMNACVLGSHGGEIVSQYLSFCWNLKILELKSNNIEAEFINKILLTMKKSCKLEKLFIFGNRFNRKTGDILRRLLESGVLPQAFIDVTITYDDILPGYRVIPYN